MGHLLKTFLFSSSVHVKDEMEDTLSLLQPNVFGGEVLDKKQPVTPTCSPGPPGPPGPQGHPVRNHFILHVLRTHSCKEKAVP